MKSDFDLIVHRLPECKEAKIYFVGDLHAGAIESNLKGWETFVQRVLQDKNAYVCLLGDLMNNATKSSVSNLFDDALSKYPRPRDQKRYLALSTDGGETYGDFRADDFLIEEKSLGCNASFLRVEREDLPAEAQALLPEEADSVTVFVNPRSDKRNTLTACVSFDSGET